MIQTAVLGCGNIGSGVVQVIEENQAQIARAVPGGMEVKYILDLRDFPGASFAHKVVHDIDIILADPEIKVICETMGGKEPAFTFTKRALEKGISVCSSNKELVEAYGPTLLQIARENHCSYLFEASVGGGIPLISPLLRCLGQEEITSILGILNGTTNYILTKMERFGADYAQVLKEAQELGYAERNPEADVEGHDTGRKIAILSSLMTGRTVRFADETVEGISGISPVDFAYAGGHGYTIKLLGKAVKTGASLEVITAPFLVPATSPLYGVSDVFNGVLVHGNMVDDLMFYGRGAGKLPTGSAVVADMISAANSDGQTLPIQWDLEVMTPVATAETKHRFFVRLAAEQEARARDLFGQELQEVWEGETGEFAFVTAPLLEGTLEEKLRSLGGAAGRLRILDPVS